MRLAEFWGQKYATQGQYFFTRVISQRLGALLAYGAGRAGLSPNAVTVLGLAVSLAGCAFLTISADSWEFLATALVLFQLGFALDCADGQLARGTGRTSAMGAWLDITCDHVRQVGLLMALAAALPKFPEVEGWIAFGAIFLLGTGLTVALHTVATLKAGAYRPHGLSGIGNLLKRASKEISDTPCFLLGICVLWPFPTLAVAYIAFMGLLYLAQAGMQARLRIGGRGQA